MKNSIKTIASFVTFYAMLIGFGSNAANAQFSKAVVVLKGSVHNEQTGKAFPVKISILNEKNDEVTASQSNSITGNYLVVIQLNKKYHIHLEGEGIVTKDEIIETPTANATVQITKDFTIVPTSAVAGTADGSGQK